MQQLKIKVKIARTHVRALSCARESARTCVRLHKNNDKAEKFDNHSYNHMQQPKIKVSIARTHVCALSCARTCVFAILTLIFGCCIRF